jgi:hypothetical protein
LVKFEKLEIPYNQFSREFIERYPVGSGPPLFPYSYGFFIILSRSAELVLVNSLFKSGDPVLANTINLEFKKHLPATKFWFYYLGLDDFKQILAETTDKIRITSFKLMSDGEKFLVSIVLYKMMKVNFDKSADIHERTLITDHLINKLDDIRKLCPAGYQITQFSAGFVTSFISKKLKDYENYEDRAEFLTYLRKDKHAQIFWEAKVPYVTLADSIDESEKLTADNLAKLHKYFHDISLLRKPGDDCEFPILTKYHQSQLAKRRHDQLPEFTKNPSPDNLASIANVILGYSDFNSLVSYLLSFYDKSSQVYVEYQTKFSISKIEYHYKSLRGFLSDDVVVPKRLILKDPIQELLLQLVQCFTYHSSAPFQFKILIQSLQEYYSFILEAEDEKITDEEKKIYLKNLKDLNATLNFVEMFVVLELEKIVLRSIELFLPRSFSCLEKFYELCSPPVYKNLHAKFFTYLDVFHSTFPVEDGSMDIDSASATNYNNSLKDLIERLDSVSNLKAVDSPEFIEAKIKNSKFCQGILKSPSDPLILTDFIEFLFTNNIWLHDFKTVSRSFIELYLFNKETRLNAILFFLLFNLYDSNISLSYQVTWMGIESVHNANGDLNRCSLMLFLTKNWMKQKYPANEFKLPDGKFREFSFFWRNPVYKLKMFFNLEAEINGPKKSDKDLLLKKDLCKIFKEMPFVPSFFAYIREIIPKRENLISFFRQIRRF